MSPLSMNPVVSIIKANTITKMAKVYTVEVEVLLTLSQQLKDQVKKLDQIIDERIKLSKPAKLLMTIPGVGRILGLTMAVEIGNICRFPNAGSLAAYVGIAPSVYSSGGKTYLGSITKHGNRYLRWALAEASLYLIKHDTVYHTFYDRLIKKGKPKAKARVAVMHKLTRAIYAILTKNIPFTYHQMLNGQ